VKGVLGYEKNEMCMGMMAFIMCILVACGKNSKYDTEYQKLEV
jgi:hypothetical protein